MSAPHPTAPQTLADFLTRWQPSGGGERANYGLFLNDLTALIGVAPPDAVTADPAQDAYVLEKPVTFNDGAGRKSSGRIDLYKRGCFVLEAKQGTASLDEQKKAAQAEAAALGFGPTAKRRKGHALRGTPKWEQMMTQAYGQALGYVRALPPTEPRPPFVVVVDLGFCIDLYANFSGVPDAYVPFPDPRRARIRLDQLADDATRALLNRIWTAPDTLDPSRAAARVTRELAQRLAVLSAQLEGAGHPSEVVAQFLMRCLFTMFSEDVELIPKGSFTRLLTDYVDDADARQHLPDALQSLWQKMDVGGFSSELKARIRRFNGSLFHEATALPLNEPQIRLLLESARADWTTVEPAIFGTLLERALDPAERHRLGAHYTPRRYVERLVLPAVLTPLRAEWGAAQAASARRAEEGDPKGAREELVKFLRRLTSVRVLDPACGSGNFLYVTLEHLKRLEGEVLTALDRTGASGLLDLGGATTVSPRQLLGLELNPRAAAIADVVLRIGYLQWHLRTHGPTDLREPLLDSFRNVENRDAVLTALPNGTYTPAEWPEADFIVGNPPFVGASRMRDALGDTYTEALRKTYAGRVSESSDLVMFWWQKAAELVKAGKVERFGFITTNSIKQPFNRRVLTNYVSGDTSVLTLVMAIPDHPWVDAADGAAVTVAFTIAEPASKSSEGELLTVTREVVADEDDSYNIDFSSQIGRIQADLTVGADLDNAQGLRANEGLANRGVQLMGAGFIVTPEKAASLGLGSTPNLEQHIWPYYNGKDIAARPRGLMVIDLFGLTADKVLEDFPDVYQHLLENVKPERDANNRATYRDNWWIFGEPRRELRRLIRELPRYIATVVTAKHRVFQFLENNIMPEDALMVIGSDDAFVLGVLSSSVHVIWALAAGSDLGGNTPRYRNTRCFDPFPFPTPTSTQQSHIRKLAEQLDAHRKRQQAAHPTLTLTDLYNVVEKLRAGQAPSALTPKEQLTHAHGLAAVVLELHRQLDAAVADAYGWPTDLPEPEVLARLVALNAERQQEEAAGQVRWLRPAYQAPEATQAALGLEATPTALPETKNDKPETLLLWPTALAEQALAVRAVVQAAPAPLTADALAARFKGAGPAKVRPLLDTLVGLGQVRVTDGGGYAV